MQTTHCLRVEAYLAHSLQIAELETAWLADRGAVPMIGPENFKFDDSAAGEKPLTLVNRNAEELDFLLDFRECAKTIMDTATRLGVPFFCFPHALFFHVGNVFVHVRTDLSRCCGQLRRKVPR